VGNRTQSARPARACPQYGRLSCGPDTTGLRCRRRHTRDSGVAPQAVLSRRSGANTVVSGPGGTGPRGRQATGRGSGARGRGWSTFAAWIAATPAPRQRERRRGCRHVRLAREAQSAPSATAQGGEWFRWVIGPRAARAGCRSALRGCPRRTLRRTTHSAERTAPHNLLEAGPAEERSSSESTKHSCRPRVCRPRGVLTHQHPRPERVS